MAYTFSFLAVTKRKEYRAECRKCNATIYFVLQQSRERGVLQCPFCSKELQIWETHDSKEIRRLLGADEGREGLEIQGQEEVSGFEKTPG